MPGTRLAGWWLTVTAPPGVNIYTQMDRARRMFLAKGCCTHTQQWNTDRQNAVHQRHKRENYELVWSAVSKVKKWQSMIWASRLWSRLIGLLLDERHFRKPVFQDFRKKREERLFQLAGRVHSLYFVSGLNYFCGILTETACVRLQREGNVVITKTQQRYGEC